MKQSKSIIRKMYYLFRSFITMISPIWTSRILYKKNIGRRLNIKNPELFDEHLMKLKIENYNNNELVIKCSSKNAVRDYVKKCGCDEILNEQYGIFDLPEDINWADMPDSFVIKMTNGCGNNIICNNKSELDYTKTNTILKKWLKQPFGYFTAELHYLKVERKIIIEKNLQDKSQKLPFDYKVYCFNGVPKCILVCSEREISLKLNMFDLNWKGLNYIRENFLSDKEIHKPINLDKMISYSKRLSKPFPFVRVDFFEVDGKVILSELTFTPAACAANYYTINGERELGLFFPRQLN